MVADTRGSITLCRPMRLNLRRSPTAREADLQRQLDLALVQLRILLRMAGVGEGNACRG